MRRKISDKRFAEIKDLVADAGSINDGGEIRQAFKDLLAEIARLKYIQCYCFECEKHRKKFEKRWRNESV